jgi:hypothetical protein
LSGAKLAVRTADRCSNLKFPHGVMVKFRENVFGSQKQHIGNSQTIIMRQGGGRVTSSISRRVTKHVRLPPGAPRLINRWHHHRLLIMDYWHGVKDRGGQKPETGELPSALHAGNTRSSVTELSNRNVVHKPGVVATLLLFALPSCRFTSSSVSSGRLRVLRVSILSHY